MKNLDERFFRDYEDSKDSSNANSGVSDVVPIAGLALFPPLRFFFVPTKIIG